MSVGTNDSSCWSETWSTLADWATLPFFFCVNWYHSEQHANCNHCNLRVWSLGKFPDGSRKWKISLRSFYRRKEYFDSNKDSASFFVVVVPQVRVTQCQSCSIAISNVFNIFLLQSPRFFLLQKYIAGSGIVVKNVWWYPQHVDLRSTPVKLDPHPVDMRSSLKPIQPKKCFPDTSDWNCLYIY